jgi:hypothetical protein
VLDTAMRLARLGVQPADWLHLFRILGPSGDCQRCSRLEKATRRMSGRPARGNGPQFPI